MIVDGTGAVDKPAHPSRRTKISLSIQQMSQLRSALARLYIVSTIAHIIAKESGIDEVRLDLRGSPLEFWNAILAESAKRCCVDKLVQRALRDYPEDTELLVIAAMFDPL